VDEWYSLIDPKDYFDGINMSIHRITEADVRGAPTFKAAMAEIERRLSDQIVVIRARAGRSPDQVLISRARAR